jgi:hypothetical protein
MNWKSTITTETCSSDYALFYEDIWDNRDKAENDR